MKSIALAAALSFVAIETLAAPQLSVDQALKIANSYLKEMGRSGTSIVGINLENTALSGGKTVWAVRWDTPVVLSETKRETGLEISMDGSYARYTERMANANSPSSAGVPADREALRNHRTRSDRPSILDLKH
jgi:hypothetical protein